MTRVALTIWIMMISLTVIGQDITGQWNGILEVQKTRLRLVFNISKTDSGYSSTMDSPDQGAKGIPVTAVDYKNSILKLSVSNAGIEYEGTLGKDGSFTGTFKQGGLSLPLRLSKEAFEKEKLTRPQEPFTPYPYYSEDVTFENRKAGITLAGTLTLPKKEGVFPVVVLISGSGPHNRNEELLGHKPFLVLSDYLTRKGFAVLRYDDRGTASSGGDFKTATTPDFATDAEAAVAYLKRRKEIDKKKIGLIGHSEGGIIAPIVASHSKDIAFIVLLAGPGVRGDRLLLMQQAAIARASGVSDADIQKSQTMNKGAFDIVTASVNPQQLKADMTAYVTKISANDPDKPSGMSNNDYVSLQVDRILNPWMTYFLAYNPAPELEKVTCPVLALNGDKDVQVPSKENLAAIKKSYSKSGNKNVTVTELPNLNHLFQECTTGLPKEYAAIEQTFSPEALKVIYQWLEMHAK